ncbi:MAG: DUF58 domain-containing protein [Deltaproteobacteria bacterium]|nr:DUF58 domain-containing protein [Deltaproteobacteria bacterium]
MIVPRSRLLGFVGVCVVPVAAVAAAFPSGMLFAAAALLLCLPIVDAVLGRGGLKGIAVALPDVVRLSEDREGKLEMAVSQCGDKDRQLRFGVAFPTEIGMLRDELVARIPGGNVPSRLTWACTPRRRGRYRLTGCHLECASPLGFWAIRGVSKLRTELRVYPGLLSDRKIVAGMFMDRERSGLHVRHQVGKGREFEKLREYIPGDGFEDIHWKATAKRGRPVTKVFRVERTQEVYVVLDTSRLSARPVVVGPSASGRGGDETVLDRYAKATMVLSMAAARQGDHFGLVTFSDRVHRFRRAGSGTRHAAACHEILYDLAPRILSPDYDELAAFLQLRLRRRALLVFLTFLDDPLLAEGFVRSAELFRRHLSLVVSLRPQGASPLFTGPDPASEDELYRRLGGHLRWHTLRELERVLERRGIRMVQPDGDQLSARLVAGYLGIKKRQLL